MALTRAQSRTLIQEWKTELDALNLKIDEARVTAMQAKSALDQLQKKREPLVDELRMMVQRHKRLFNEDV